MNSSLENNFSKKKQQAKRTRNERFPLVPVTDMTHPVIRFPSGDRAVPLLVSSFFFSFFSK